MTEDQIQAKIIRHVWTFKIKKMAKIQRMKKFVVKYSINYPSGKKWVTQKECYGITRLGAIDTVEWLHSNNDISIISVEFTGEYSALGLFGDNHTLGER